MKVTLLPELFEPPVRHSLLITFLNYPLEDRHRIELDTTHASVAAWLSSQAPGLQEQIEFALELSTQAEALEPSHTIVHVTRGPTNLESAPPHVHIGEARRFLDSPFVILVEDSHSDRAFLQRMMTDEERRFLQQRIDAGFVRVDHGGGTGPMRRRVRDEVLVPASRHTLWVLFDSDAMQPGAPSTASEALHAACGPVAHHQLRRRYAESYLTLQALHGWAASVAKRSEREERLQCFRAFAEMEDDQRYHYNMKEGFAKDARRTDATAGTLYRNVSDHDRRALEHGFGEDIGELFAGDSVTEADLRRDTSGWMELRPVLVDLLARIR